VNRRDDREKAKDLEKKKKRGLNGLKIRIQLSRRIGVEALRKRERQKTGRKGMARIRAESKTTIHEVGKGRRKCGSATFTGSDNVKERPTSKIEGVGSRE